MQSVCHAARTLTALSDAVWPARQRLAPGFAQATSPGTCSPSGGLGSAMECGSDSGASLNVGFWQKRPIKLALWHGRNVPLFAVPRPQHVAYGERISLHERTAEAGSQRCPLADRASVIYSRALTVLLDRSMSVETKSAQLPTRPRAQRTKLHWRLSALACRCP